MNVFTRLKISISLAFILPLAVFSKQYTSQFNQDKYVHEKFFKNRDNGFFVELGAFDGISLSNTYFFEKNLGWEGICIEPMIKPFNKLKVNRNCICINACISDKIETKKFFNIHINGAKKKQHQSALRAEMLSGIIDEYDPKHLERINTVLKRYNGKVETTDIQTKPLQSVFDEYAITHVDFISLDTEGNELKILKSIDYSKTHISVIIVENNYFDPKIRHFLTQKGFKYDRRLHVDEVYYIPEDFPQLNQK